MRIIAIILIWVACFSGSVHRTEQTGTVERYNKSKQHGTIIRDSDDKEIYFHKDDLIDEVKNLDRVRFVVRNGSKGLYAVDVRKEVE